MFTGIVEDLGRIDSIRGSEQGAVITIHTGLPLSRIRVGDSIAVNGACLTVTRKGRGAIAMDVSAETLRRTTLGDLGPGAPVNLERCLTLEKLVGGHLVSGHVDGIGRVAAIVAEGESRLFTFEVAEDQARYLVEKGSLAVDGVSLTVFSIQGRRFQCALIPHTLRMTTLGHREVGARVNIESDMLVKYVERMLGEGRAAAPGTIAGGQS